MNPSVSLRSRRLGSLGLVMTLLALSGCATAMLPVAVDANHPANPNAPSGTPAPADFSLLAPSPNSAPTTPRPDANENAPAHVHHHDS